MLAAKLAISLWKWASTPQADWSDLKLSCHHVETERRAREHTEKRESSRERYLYPEDGEIREDRWRTRTMETDDRMMENSLSHSVYWSSTKQMFTFELLDKIWISEINTDDLQMKWEERKNILFPCEQLLSRPHHPPTSLTSASSSTIDESTRHCSCTSCRNHITTRSDLIGQDGPLVAGCSVANKPLPLHARGRQIKSLI